MKFIGRKGNWMAKHDHQGHREGVKGMTVSQGPVLKRDLVNMKTKEM
jgi:hypothetical protein